MKRNQLKSLCPNVFAWAASQEAQFENFYRECGKERKTTFFSDLSIAEWYGTEEIIDTHNRVLKEWSKDRVFFTEYTICLNHKIWAWYNHDEEVALLYHNLWTQACNVVEEEWNGEDLSYYYQMTD